MGYSPYADKHPEGVKTYAWFSEADVMLSCKTCHDVDVHPDNPINPCSFLIVPLDTGIARQLEAADVKDPQPKCRVYFTTCEICPDRCRIAEVYDTVSLNGNLVELPEGCTKQQMKVFLQATANIKLKFPSMSQVSA